MSGEKFYYKHQWLIQEYEQTLELMAQVFPPCSNRDREELEELNELAIGLLAEIAELEEKFYANNQN